MFIITFSRRQKWNLHTIVKSILHLAAKNIKVCPYNMALTHTEVGHFCCRGGHNIMLISQMLQIWWRLLWLF